MRQRREHLITFVVRDDEREALRELAERMGWSQATTLRTLVRDAAKAEGITARPQGRRS